MTSLFDYIFGSFAPLQQVQAPDYDSPIYPAQATRYIIDKYSHNKVTFDNNFIRNIPTDTSSCSSSLETTSSDQCYLTYPKVTRERSLPNSDSESLRSSHSSMDDIIGPKYKKPRVTINNCVNVILIPTRNEYYVVGLGRDIWWSREELYNVKIGCQEEILKHVAESNSSITIKDVMRQLYQP